MTAPKYFGRGYTSGLSVLMAEFPPIGGRDLLLPTDKEVVIARPTQP